MLIFVHVAEDFLHGRGTDGVAKVELFQASGWNLPQERKGQQQSTETGRPLRLLSAHVLAQHHLSLILQILHLHRVLWAI